VSARTDRLLGDDPFLTPAEVARIFRVDPKTVGRWAIEGLLPSTRTPGGHRRFRRSDVDALLKAGAQ
jgi:excisionase family DNA binding protein